MNTSTLDTSGCVPQVTGNAPEGQTLTIWSDLDAFTQGYIEAMFASMPADVRFVGESGEFHSTTSFRDLAPETLARIMEDCAAYRETEDCAVRAMSYADPAALGARFWEVRQAGEIEVKPLPGYAYAKSFPPLTPYLSDDGKVMLRDA